ncbi:hypothetical protein [Sinorhizobium sp. BG8]|uniref:hypothetical protein n=1 Tax=Sinorhizobium sp. BG8 TaxID=2613773 RepID=UPI00193E0A11|nr:hypothetical protein [Sinorhizobium sp. BG8]QRM55378.1 hypothetical protein F3Y30_13205 [Sinorhizobium sp. BG8]
MLWLVIVFALLLAAYLYQRHLRGKAETPLDEETGLAIIQFGQAFPNEAIREVATTVDQRHVFLRLHDGKAGHMHVHGHHFGCHLIEPGTVRATPEPSGKALKIEFEEYPTENGLFEFRTVAEAAEVSLWLLGSFMPTQEMARG